MAADIALGEGLVAVIDGNGPLSHLSIFSVDEDGNLTLEAAAIINAAANGVAWFGARTERKRHSPRPAILRSVQIS